MKMYASSSSSVCDLSNDWYAPIYQGKFLVYENFAVNLILILIEVTGESITGVLAIQSDSLYVFDQWCIAWGQSGSMGLWQLSNPFVNQTAYERHPMKSIKTNLATAVQLRAPWMLNPWWINDGFSKLWWFELIAEYYF